MPIFFHVCGRTKTSEDTLPTSRNLWFWMGPDGCSTSNGTVWLSWKIYCLIFGIFPWKLHSIYFYYLCFYIGKSVQHYWFQKLLLFFAPRIWFHWGSNDLSLILEEHWIFVGKKSRKISPIFLILNKLIDTSSSMLFSSSFEYVASVHRNSLNSFSNQLELLWLEQDL